MSPKKVDQILKLAEMFEKLATGGGIYVVFRRGTIGDFYGPFADKESAEKISYFAQSVGTSDQHLAFHMYPFRVYYYDDNEIQALKDDPAELTNGEYTKVNFHPAHIPMHQSWKDFFKDGTFTPDQWWQGKVDGRW